MRGRWLALKLPTRAQASMLQKVIRMPRLAVIDAAAVDGRRRLVLVRRDNVEHLLMIGGPADLVVEPNIVRGALQAHVNRMPVSITTSAAVCPTPSAGLWTNISTVKSIVLAP